MADYVIKDGELYHYGVLGMKWGVRRGETKTAYSKATKKLNKLNAKIEKADAKARKKSWKADKKQNSLMAFGRERADRKAKRASYKAAKRVVKAKKWLDKMDKTFKDTDVSLTKEQVAMGKAYVERLNTRATLRELR